MTRISLLWLPAFFMACGGGGTARSPSAGPAPVAATGATAATIDSLWQQAEQAVRLGKWSDAQKLLDRAILELTPGDPRVARAHFYLGEALFGQNRHLEAAREFRRASDETPNDPIAPEALLRLGDVYADLWRRPELDPTYGQTALSTYQELLNRYPESNAAKRGQIRVSELNERFAAKSYKAAMFYFRLKAFDSAILYLKDLVANYPRTIVVPEALVRLVQAYKALGYREDVQETCDYIRRFHPKAPKVGEVCPTKHAGA